MVHFWGHTTWRCDSKKIIATGSKWKHKLMIARPKFCYCATSAAHPKCAKTLSKKKLQLISIKFCFDWKKFLTPSSILSKNFFSIGSKSDFNETSLKRRSQRSLSRSETRGFPEWRWSRDQKKRKYFFIKFQIWPLVSRFASQMAQLGFIFLTNLSHCLDSNPWR